MALDDVSAAEILQGEENNASSPQKRKRTKDPGVRVKGARIYDSENGKTCHQCRQKTRDFAALCKQLKNNKQCPLTFCHKCLLNRYGEKADEVEILDDWMCPKCRGVCNCSFCMKRKGCHPTGIMAHAAKATGFNSVHELLHNNGEEPSEPKRLELTASPRRSAHSIKKSLAAIKKCHDKENQKEIGSNEEGLPKKEKKKGVKRVRFAESDNAATDDKENAANLEAEPRSKVCKSKKLDIKTQTEANKEDIVLPQGRLLTEIAGTEFPAQDVGAALQFLEFCNSFSKVLDITEGQPESVLRDLTRLRVKRDGTCSAHIDFNIKLLSIMFNDVEKERDAWLQTLKTCIEESECTLGELPLDFLDKGLYGYHKLRPSDKLKILNFLCDEVLLTGEMRNWIDEAETKFDEGRKENKEKVQAAKKKEKLLKQKVKDETAKAVLQSRGGIPLTLSEFDDLLTKLRTEVDKVHTEVVASLELVPKKNQRCDAVRTDYMVLGHNGQTFWKLSGYNDRSNIILQDVGNWDLVTTQDKWLVYSDEEESVVEKYISSLRNQLVKHNSTNAEEGMKSDFPDSPEFEHLSPEGDTDA